MSHRDTKGPMSGYWVIDLKNVVSGPATTIMMADQGADIIKRLHISGALGSSLEET